MIKRLLLSAILGVGLLFVAAQAPAYVVQTSGSGYVYATGITDLTIGGLGIYDVVFRYGTPSAFTFVTAADAKTAADAINVALTAYAVNEVADPTTSGSWTTFRYYDVPYALAWTGSYNAVDSTGSSAVWSASEMQYIAGVPFMFAAITPAASVPIPGAVWLLGTGLLGLVALRRRCKK